ncbi:hypothetical protein EYZ11_002129 [Aspergillus tanneri]|uniref:Uncharacterized protein n=1 Tax=Aspergillus tanneri TaxID=1220188 RepID=A0A4S3JSD8_9EURO|nr:hypothetical protein EYZ11_002129 [Aspergillus tanneri]
MPSDAQRYPAYLGHARMTEKVSMALSFAPEQVSISALGSLHYVAGARLLITIDSD